MAEGRRVLGPESASPVRFAYLRTRKRSYSATVSDPQWVTQRQAAALLGVHPSLIPKMLRRGDLKSRVQAPSRSHSEVLSLAEARAAETAKLEARRAAKASGPRPPDEEHEWLLAPLAAAVLGCTEIGLGGRAARGQVPYVVHGGRRWFRLDQIELQVRSEVSQRTRRP